MCYTKATLDHSYLKEDIFIKNSKPDCSNLADNHSEPISETNIGLYTQSFSPVLKEPNHDSDRVIVLGQVAGVAVEFM